MSLKKLPVLVAAYYFVLPWHQIQVILANVIYIAIYIVYLAKLLEW